MFFASSTSDCIPDVVRDPVILNWRSDGSMSVLEFNKGRLKTKQCLNEEFVLLMNIVNSQKNILGLRVDRQDDGPVGRSFF